jgi:hypothetical protein
MRFIPRVRATGEELPPTNCSLITTHMTGSR